MKKTWTFVCVILLTLSACGTQRAATPTAAVPTIAPAPTAQPTGASAQAAQPSSKPPSGHPLPTARDEFFAASGVCAVCHTKMRDAAGADVSLDTAWRSTLMANSVRDPYWQASFRSEVLIHPEYQEIIEDKCTACHAPMAHFTAATQGEKGKGLDDGFFSPDHPLHTLAIDGVSCTLCHQISGSNFGQPDSHSGAYVIDAALPVGQRVTYGPFPVTGSQAAIMQGSSGFVPQESTHVQQSELCAVCHTLYTPYLDGEGQIAGEFAEQTVYLEWHDSDFRETHSCQNCHMPEAQGGVVLSVTGGEPRTAYSQHAYVGGNTYVLSLLLQFADELETTASMGDFSATMQRLLDQLQNRSATVSIGEVNLSGEQLSASVFITNQTGHKLPTSYPSRRAWLHFTVRDADDQVIFESGGYNADGSIVGNANDDDPASYEPHFLTIDSPDQVQIYEAIMENSDGEVTTTLLRGANYVKDNRLLPAGFDTVNPDIAVNGQAAKDPDFVGGSDRVQFEIPLVSGGAGQPTPSGPFRVTVDLLYQAISYRWIDNLREHSAPEIDRFLAYEQVVPNWPIVLARTSVEVGD